MITRDRMRRAGRRRCGRSRCRRRRDGSRGRDDFARGGDADCRGEHGDWAFFNPDTVFNIRLQSASGIRFVDSHLIHVKSAVGDLIRTTFPDSFLLVYLSSIHASQLASDSHLFLADLSLPQCRGRWLEKHCDDTSKWHPISSASSCTHRW